MPDARVFLANSGTEAVEAALKLARHHTGRPNVIAFLGAFHGRSLGSLSLTASKARQRAGFGIVTPGQLPRPVLRPLRRRRARPAPAYIEEVLFKQLTDPPTSPRSSSSRSRAKAATSSRRPAGSPTCGALCDPHGILLVLDEVQSGIGRTGTMWACEHDGVEPDIMCIGKGLASGLPLAGIVARAEIMDWEPGGHGSTFGGNPVACAAALATLDLVEAGWPPTPPRSATTCSPRSSAADDQPLINHVRGRGLMIGIDLPDHDTAGRVEEACFRRGLLTLTCGERTLRLAPPLVVTTAQADIAVAILADALADWQSDERCRHCRHRPAARATRCSPRCGVGARDGDLAGAHADHRRLARPGRPARPTPTSTAPSTGRRGVRRRGAPRRRRCAATSCAASASCSASTRTTSASWCRSRPARSAPRASARSRR